MPDLPLVSTSTSVSSAAPSTDETAAGASAVQRAKERRAILRARLAAARSRRVALIFGVIHVLFALVALGASTTLLVVSATRKSTGFTGVPALETILAALNAVILGCEPAFALKKQFAHSVLETRMLTIAIDKQEDGLLDLPQFLDQFYGLLVVPEPSILVALIDSVLPPEASRAVRDSPTAKVELCRRAERMAPEQGDPKEKATLLKV